MEPAVRDLGRVVEDAVEHNSWGKSRSDRKCRFPNTGGLHRTSGDAPLDTQNINYDNLNIYNLSVSHCPLGMDTIG